MLSAVALDSTASAVEAAGNTVPLVAERAAQSIALLAAEVPVDSIVKDCREYKVPGMNLAELTTGQRRDGNRMPVVD